MGNLLCFDERRKKLWLLIKLSYYVSSVYENESEREMKSKEKERLGKENEK